MLAMWGRKAGSVIVFLESTSLDDGPALQPRASNIPGWTGGVYGRRHDTSLMGGGSTPPLRHGFAVSARGGLGRELQVGVYCVMEEQELQLEFTDRQLRMVLGWRQAGAFFPDEDRVLRKLVEALAQSTPLQLSRLQVQIIHGWAEEELGGSYGGGEVANPEEAVVLSKLQRALAYD